MSIATPSDSLFTNFVKALYSLDQAAIPLADGTPTGLWWYHRHLQGDGPKPGKYCNEERMFEAMVASLRADGVEIRSEQWYDDDLSKSRQSCDVVMNWPGLGQVWIEVKCAWKHDDRFGKKRNGNYLKHLGRAADDITKLVALDTKRADAVAFLLVGFDHPQDGISEDDVACIRERTPAAIWSNYVAEWTDRRPNSGRVRVWCWIRRLQHTPHPRWQEHP